MAKQQKTNPKTQNAMKIESKLVSKAPAVQPKTQNAMKIESKLVSKKNRK